MIRFQDPWVLGLLLLIPLALWYRNRRDRSTGALRFSAVDTVEDVGGGVARWKQWLPGALRVLAAVAMVFALARPQTSVSSQNVLTEGIDIVMVMDLSSSMLAEDLEPNRLEAAKLVATDFVSGRLNDRIGVVAFAGKAFTQSPLTFDRNVVQNLLFELESGMIEDGTAVGMGLATAVKRLEASEAASRVAILITDGSNNRGEIGPLTAAQMAEALGVRVYTIGVGTRGQARVPVTDDRGRRRYITTEVDIDEESLQAVAERTGGRYFRATDNQSLAAIYEEIDQLETTEIEVENFTRFEERFPPFLLTGLLLLTLELTLTRTILRRLP